MTGGEWWNSDTGDNMLAGVYGDADNPIRLPDDYIVAFLQRIPAARDSFNRMVGNMLRPLATIVTGRVAVRKSSRIFSTRKFARLPANQSGGGGSSGRAPVCKSTCS